MLQLKKSIRLQQLGQPFKRALQTASQLGADAVEINGRTDLHPSQMSRTAIRHLLKILTDLNLKVSAIHFPTRRGFDVTDELERRIDATKAAMTMAFDLGASVVVNHVGRIPEDEATPAWTTMVEALTDIGRHSQKSGAWLAATTGSEDGTRVKALIDALPPMSLGVDFDPGDLIINGFSADESIKQLGAHVMNFRARDAVRDLAQGRGLEVQLGRGSVDWATQLSVLEEHHYTGFLTLDRQFEQDAFTECTQSFSYLDNLFD